MFPNSPQIPVAPQANGSFIFKLSFYFSNKPFFSSFLIAACFLSMIYVFFNPHYQYADDIQVLLLLKGVGLVQAPSALNQRENILLCTLLKELYIYFPRFQWYSGLLVLTQFLSFWAMLAAFQWGPHRGFRTFLFIFAAAGLGAYFFSNLQWTMTSSLAGLGAFFLSVALWREKDREPPFIAYLLFFLLVILGAQIRYPSVGLVILVSLPTVWALMRDRTLTPVRKTLVWFMAATALVSCLLVGYNHQFYRRDPGWVKFADFFNQHFELHEARFPVYDAQSKPVFDSVGWTPNDLFMFQDWYFLDENIYSVEKLKKLSAYFPRFGFDKNPGFTLAQKLSFDTTQIALFFFLALLWLIPRGSYRALGLTALWTFLMLAFLMAYEKLPERVFLPALFFLVILCVFFAVPKWKNASLDHKKPTFPAWAAAGLAVLLSLFTAYFLQKEYARNNRWVQCEGLMKTCMEGLHPKDDQLYVLSESAFPFEFNAAFDDFEMFRHFNVVALTWFQRSPTTRTMMNRFGVKDLFKDMVDNPNILIICLDSEVEYYKTHMREKYGLETVFEPVYQCTFFQVCRVHKASSH